MTLEWSANHHQMMECVCSARAHLNGSHRVGLHLWTALACSLSHTIDSSASILCMLGGKHAGPLMGKKWDVHRIAAMLRCIVPEEDCQICREKEMLKALQAQEKQATRLRQRDAAGPKDDLDLEWEGLLAAQRAEG